MEVSVRSWIERRLSQVPQRHEHTEPDRKRRGDRHQRHDRATTIRDSRLNQRHRRQNIQSDRDADVVVAGGMESMSNVPYYLEKARAGYRMGDGKVVDGMDVVNKIAKIAKGGAKVPPGTPMSPADVPTTPVVITSAYIVEPAK